MSLTATEECNAAPSHAPEAPPDPSPPSKKKRGPKLRSLRSAQDQLADVYRKTKSGELVPRVANSLVYILSTWTEVTVLVEAEGRLSAIEDAIRKAREAAQ
ncbi:MAG: hypothetical protein ACYC8T_20860 [Myxococcaceae bacterium]